METEGVTIEFTSDAIDSIASFAMQVNEQTENIGARRLQTIMEKLLEEISFEGPDLEPKSQRVDAYVENMLETVKIGLELAYSVKTSQSHCTLKDNQLWFA